MRTPHKHAELIKAWADGAEIQFRYNANIPWSNVIGVCGWDKDCEFRIKPEPKPDVVLLRRVDLQCRPSNDFPSGYLSVGVWDNQNLKLIFDGDTGKLKSAEVLK